MKQAPQIIFASDLIDFEWPVMELPTNPTVTSSCRFVYVRPKSKGGLISRIELAWGVFKGNYDALRWDCQ